MNLCSEKHEEICYEGRNCPACEINAELMETINDRNDLLLRIEKLEAESE